MTAPIEAPGLSAKLAEIRDATREREGPAIRPASSPAPLSPKLTAIKEATKAFEEAVKRRSTRLPPPKI
jgi:hypothetical protein